MKNSENKILVFGNPLIEEDNLPLRLMKKLKKSFPSVEFKECDIENIHEEGRNLNIIDTARGINKVELINDIDSIKTEKIYSLHDFDLGYTLKLMKKMDMIDSVKIFAVPFYVEEEKVLEDLKKKIRSSLL